MATRQAIENLESRLEANHDSLVFSRLAESYLDRGETDRALETCLKGVDLHPRSTTGRIVLGRCLIKKERFEEAIGVFAEVCRLDERNSMAMKILGDLFARHGSSDLAGDLYRLAARLDPFDASMAAVAARAIGSGKTDLLDIIEEGVADAKTPKINDAAPVEKSDEAGPAAVDVPETAESKIDAAPEASGEEIFDTVEIAESEPFVADVAGETGVRAEVEPLETTAAEPSGNAPSGSEPVEILPDDVALREEGPVSGSMESSELVVDAGSLEGRPAQAEAPTATDAAEEPFAGPVIAEIPDGQEISSRLDMLFGEESPASRGAAGVTADRLIIDTPEEETTVVNDRPTGHASAIPEAGRENLITDEPGDSPLAGASSAQVPPGENEELILDSRDDLLVEEGENQEKRSPVDSRGAEHLIIDEPPAADSSRPFFARHEGPLPQAGPAFGGLEIATPTLAEIYFKQGQLQQALAIYRRLIEKEPGNDRLQRQIEAVEAAIASGGEGIASLEQERGKASRKSAGEPAGSSLTPPSAAEAAPGSKPRAKTNFKWIKKPHDRG